ncbi:hypothetical protein FEM48_Zijuj09G0185900 [Ziziphus jujuba var. spinosa]|uniref:Uncharacterized protein n=1 Tax=Ziziphus jujuba var. spinosa TaxID=714518 RepID=A0A978UUM4_ZIZJJ|nr:hypothetical protein FEM48_Zijuj09G0185900 [Ziziphus jujuba var. spinosa]
MAIDIKSVEKIIGYEFKNTKYLEEALTHPSMGTTGSPSYQRLQFLGDAVIGLAVSKHFFLAKSHLSPGQLTSLRSANVSNHKLARVAARLGLYHHVQGTNIRNSLKQADKFEKEVREEEEEWLVYGGAKGPKFLADIVESIAAAIYVDLDFNMQKLCPILEKSLLKPMLTLKDLGKHPQPIIELYELCQKQGKQIEIECESERDGYKNHCIASVYIDEKLFVSESSELKKNARFNAASAALSKLRPKWETPANDGDGDYETEGEDEEELHDHGLHDQKKKWTKTIYGKRDEGLD